MPGSGEFTDSRNQKFIFPAGLQKARNGILYTEVYSDSAKKVCTGGETGICNT